jgi:hypothetical protein
MTHGEDVFFVVLHRELLRFFLPHESSRSTEKEVGNEEARTTHGAS